MIIGQRLHTASRVPAFEGDRPDDYQSHPAAREPAPLPRLQQAGLVVLAGSLLFIVLFWRLGGPSFWDPDEAHYAETTSEMLATGDWWAPYYNEQPFFDKPVLFHQLQAASMLAFGRTEFASRLVPALAGLGLVLVTGWFAAATVSVEAGIVAALLMAASPGLFALARYAILDTLFTMFLFGGAALVAVAALRDRPRLQWPGYVALAFAVMTKGPLTFVLTGLTFAIAVACSSDLRHRLLGLRWVAGLLLVVALSSPWFIYMYWRFGQAFINGYVLDENVRLYAGRRFGRQPNFYFYFQILAAGLLPWTGLIVGRLFDDVRNRLRGERLDTVQVLLWSWTAAVIAFFSFSTFKLDHYVFPVAPALCIVCARTWFDLRVDRFAPRHAGARLGLHLLGTILVAVGVGCGFFLVARLELPAGAIAVPIALTVAGCALTALVNVRGGLPPRVPWIVLSAITITYFGIVAFVMPALEHRKVVDDIAQWVAADSSSARLATFRMDRWNPTFRFYSGRHVTFLEDAAAARTFFDDKAPFLCLMRKSAFDEFVAQGVPLRIVLEREGMWATTGRALWRQRIPMTRFVLVTDDRR